MLQFNSTEGRNANKPCLFCKLPVLDVIMDANVMKVLKQLKPSGPDGFEGLVASLLESLTDAHFNLAISGSQVGRDLTSRRAYGNVIAVECKRYGENRSLDERELLGEIAQIVQAIPDLDVWVLV